MIMFEDRGTLWVIHIGNDDRIALRAVEEGFVCIGWTKMGDVSSYTTRDSLRDAMQATWPGFKKRKLGNNVGQVFRFAHEMKIGDPVVLPVKPTREVAIGKITGDYRFAADDEELVENDYSNVRPVEWLKVVPRTAFSKAALHSFGAFMTVSTSNDYLEEVETVLRGETVPEPETTPDVAGLEDEEEEESVSLYETALQETEDTLLRAWERTGAAFEHIVAAVLRAMGYTATVTQASGDHGVDVIAHPDPLGLKRPYIKVQVKSGTSPVNEAVVNQLRGCLNDGEQGILVSLGKFRSDALSVARNSPNITLVGPEKFVELFLEHYDELDPTVRAKYPLKRVFVPVT